MAMLLMSLPFSNLRSHLVRHHGLGRGSGAPRARIAGLKARIDPSGEHPGPDGKITRDDIYQAAFQSYHTKTPYGFNLQASWNTIDKLLALSPMRSNPSCCANILTPAGHPNGP